MANRNKISPDDLKRLRNDVEVYIGRKLESPADYNYLSEKLWNEGYGYVSATTLKRVWGYLADKGEEYSPGKFTIRALCALLGFKSLTEYCAENSPLQSMDYKGEYLETAALSPDAEISVLWPPNRKIRLRHIRPAVFEVLSNENSRLKEGDIVECPNLTQHAPAFFRVRRQGVKPFSYIAGSAQGVFYLIHSHGYPGSDL